VERSLTRGGPYALLFAGLTATSYADQAVTNGTTYYYVVTAENDFGASAASNEASTTPVAGKLPTPVITPAGGSFSSTETVTVTLSDDNPAATVRYTLDGSSPTAGSPAYDPQSPIILNGTATVKARAFLKGYLDSDVATGSFCLTPPAPQAITCGQTVNGNLGYGAYPTHSVDRGQGYFADYYSFTGTAGEVVTSQESSTAFDTCLYLSDASGALVAQNDDSDGTTSSKIVYTALAAGAYTIEATSCWPGATGAYTLTETCSGGPGAPHMVVSVNGVDVPNQGSVHFGTTLVGQPIVETILITNTGTAALDLTDDSALVSGFTMQRQPDSPVAPGQSTALILSLDATSAGSWGGSCSISDNDPAANPFEFSVSGAVSQVANPPVPQGGQNTFPLTGYSYLYGNTWAITNPSGTTIATDTARNGWSVTLDGATQQVTVTAPADAPVEAGYTVVDTQSTAYESAVFDVVPGAGAPAPAAPANLAATGGQQNGQPVVWISWSPSANATSYNLYRGTAAGGESTTPVATGITATSYTDSGVANGTTYYYVVMAVNGAGESGDSNEASATPQEPKVAAPVITPDGGRFNGSLSVTVGCATVGAAIYTTTDGTDPATSAPRSQYG
jgi:fibronectin type 3 domain-containing protein